MKKILVRVLLVIVVLIVAVAVVLGLFLDSAVKKGIETVGPQLTKVSIKLDGVSLSALSGSGKISGLEVGNPEGYKSPTAISLGSASVAVRPGSLLSDKIIIKHIRVEAPEITIEGSPTKNNLTKILENIEAVTGGGGGPTEEKSAAGEAPRKLQVDEFLLTGAKVNYVVPGLGGKSISIVMPDIKLTDLGTGPEGITVGVLTERVMSQLTADLVPLLTEQIGKLGKDALGTAAEEAGNAAKGVLDLLKKK